MEQKMTLRQIDCSPSKEGGLLVSLHLLPEQNRQLGASEAQPKRRRRRRQRLSSEQMLELARLAIDDAVSDNAIARRSHAALTTRAGGSIGRANRLPRRPPWPG